jgi:thiol-disulfide isomerase/thioredoxin
MILEWAVALALAAEPELPSALQPHPDKLLVHEVLELRPTPGHHFEPKARQLCGAEKPFELTPRRFRCQLNQPGDVKVTASACEDSGKLCLPETFFVHVDGKAGAPSAAPAANAPHLPPIEGFLTDQPEKALAQAKSGHKLLYIHFGAIWCPPCNMLEELTYPTPEFKKASAGYVLLRLDADADVSWDWKTRFKVGGYPTLIIADEQLREIGRVVGWLPAPMLAGKLDELQRLKDQPVDSSKDGLRVGRWHYERGEYARARKAFAGRKEAEAHRYDLLSEAELAKQEDRKDALIRAYRALVGDFPADVELSGWLAELLELDKPFAAARLEQAKAVADAWVNDPKLDATGYTKGDVYEGTAELLDSAGSQADAKTYYRKGAEAFGAMAERSPLTLSRGPNIERAYCLRKSGDTKAAGALYEKLVAAYPDEFTFRRSYAEMLLEQGDKKKAYEQASLAAEHSYGDNWLRAVHLKASLELQLGKKDEARRTLETALSEASLPSSTQLRTHRYIAKLRGLLAKLDQPGAR